MAGQTNDEKSKYARLDRLSTEALEEILRADIESPDDDDDNNDAIFHILEVIEQREKEHPTGRLSDVDKAWADFQRYYNTQEGEGLSLYPNDVLEKPPSDIQITHEPALLRVSVNRVRRTLIIAAIVVSLVVFAMPSALGYQNFLQMIGQWTESIFHFGPAAMTPSSPQGSGSDSSTENIGEYDSLQSALDDFGITESVVPAWIADGFKLMSVAVTSLPEFHTIDFNAFYENDAGQSISISIVQRDFQGSYIYEKSEISVIHYTAGEITHYIFENNDRIVATWYIGTLECSIKADLPLADVEKMINSIYER